MKPHIPAAVTGAFVLTCIPVLLSVGSGAPAPVERKRILSEEACRSIVQEASTFILTSLKTAKLNDTFLDPRPRGEIRANALLIALAAQNRMGVDGVEGRRLATLRDATLRLVEAIEKHRYAEAPKLAQTLARFPKLEPDPQAKLVRYRLKSRFDHDDVVVVFGGCGGRRGHKIQSELFRFERQQTPFTPAESEKLELLAYKVALVAEFVRDLDDFMTVRNAGRRKMWVGLATDVQSGGWELADVARARNTERAKKTLQKINQTCSNCHNNFFN